MRHITRLAAAVAAIVFAACEEEDSPIMFSVESNSDSANVKVEYYSPDPCCIGKSYYITAKQGESDLVLRSTNCSNVWLAEGQGGALFYRSSEGRWTATVSGGNVVTLHFDSFDPDTAEIAVPAEAYSFLKVEANTRKGLVSTGIRVARYRE